MSDIHLLDSIVASTFYGSFATLKLPQEAAIRPLIEGNNLVLSSGTGSGKTEAVLAPIISLYWEEAVKTEALVVLYIAPTKALVNDLAKRISFILAKLNLRTGIRHGDQDDLNRTLSPHVLITTPESLDVLIFKKEKNLNSIKAIIIDEVHLLYNTQRGLQLSILIQRLRASLNHSIQWVALSATVGNLKHIRDFLFSSKEDCVFLKFPSQRDIYAYITHIQSELDLTKIIHKLVLGHPATKILFFCNSRRECERVATILRSDDSLSMIKVFTHYSSLSSEVRVEIENNFSQPNTSAICIATSTLELGIDIGDIDAVILWGLPHSVESFLQRIGRSNRRENKTNVICLVPDQSKNWFLDALCFLTFIHTAREGLLPIRTPYHLYGAVAQQCLSYIASRNGGYTRVAEICQFIENKGYLSREVIDSILTDLSAEQYLQKHGFKNQYGGNDRLYKLVDYRMIYGNFSVRSKVISICYKNQILGEVPTDNLFKISRGDVVKFASRCWKVNAITAEKIVLEPTSSSRNAIDFSYSGKASGIDAFIYNHMWSLIYGEHLKTDVLSKSLRDKFSSRIKILQDAGRLNIIPFIRSIQGYLYFTFSGCLVNKAVALIHNQYDFVADEITLLTRSPVEWKATPDNPEAYEMIFSRLVEDKLDQSIYQELLPEGLQKKEVLEGWLKDMTIVDILHRLSISESVQIDAFEAILSE